MHEPTEAPTGRTSRRGLVILAVVILVGAVAGLLVWRLGGRTDTAALSTTTSRPVTTTTNRPPAGVQPLAGHRFCGGSIRIYTNTDADMLRIARTLGEDSRSAGVFTRTKQESYAEYQRVFADQPSMLTVVRPEALPAEADVLPATHLDLARFADQLRAEFPTAQTIDWTPRAPTCPASGEWPSPTPTG